MERSNLFATMAVLAMIVLAGLLFLAVASSSPVTSGWELPGNGTVGYLYAGSDGTLYAFRGNEIDAIRDDGTVAWTLNVSSPWRVLNNWMVSIYSMNNSGRMGGYWSIPVLAEKDRSLFVYAIDTTLRENSSELMTAASSMVMKVSPAGKIEWTYDFSVNVSTYAVLYSGDYFDDSPVSISVRNERVFVFHDYGEDVLDADGRFLFRIPDIADPPAIDEDGRIYAVRTALPAYVYNESEGMDGRLANGSVVVGENLHREKFDPTYRIPGSTVVAYDPDGSLVWSQDIGLNATRMYVARDVLHEYGGLPLYWNGTLLVPMRDGIVALDDNGSVLWTRQMDDGTYVPFEMMPMDSHGNLYLTSVSEFMIQSRIVTISPEGTIGASAWDYQMYADRDGSLNLPVPLAGRDGIVYAISGGSMNGVISGDDFDQMFRSRQHSSNTLTAYDVRNNTSLWSFEVPGRDRHALTLNEGNILEAMPDWPYSSINRSWDNVYFDYYTMDDYPLTPTQNSIIQIYPGDKLTYLNYDFIVYERPVFPERSRCVYARDIYVLDANGRMVGKLAVDGGISEAMVRNDTLFYATGGKIGGSTVTLAAGLAFAAVAYVFLKFFLFGTVTRAREQLDQNPNRNRVRDYVAGHPGSTAYDIARGLSLNLGTVRYHLLILGINHRIREYRSDGKFVRFFPNSNAYTDDERVIISLVRRKTMRRTLTALRSMPGASNHDLAVALGVSTTAASNYMQELSEAGIVEKEIMPGNRVAYNIAERYQAITEAVLTMKER